MGYSPFEYYKTLEEDGVILFFNGPVSQNVVEEIGDMLKHQVSNSGSGMTVARKIFAVMVEQLQNIISYSVKPPATKQTAHTETSGAPPSQSDHTTFPAYSSGQIIVRKIEEGYKIACSNRIQSSLVPRIKDKVTAINGMNKEELKVYYKQQRRAGSDSESLGAGLGFIEMARKASKPLDISFHRFDESTSIFSVAVSI